MLKSAVYWACPLFFLVFACSKADGGTNTSHLPKVEKIPTLTAQNIDGEWKYETTITNFDYNSRTFNKKNENSMEDYSVILQFSADSARMYGYPFLRFNNVAIKVSDDIINCHARIFVPLRKENKVFQFGDTLLLGFETYQFWLSKYGSGQSTIPNYTVFIRTDVNKDSLQFLDSCQFNWTVACDKWHYGKDTTRIIELENGNVYRLPGFLDLTIENKSNFSHYQDILTFEWKDEAYRFKIFKIRQDALYMEYLGELDTFIVQYFRPPLR